MSNQTRQDQQSQDSGGGKHGSSGNPQGAGQQGNQDGGENDQASPKGGSRGSQTQKGGSQGDQGGKSR